MLAAFALQGCIVAAIPLVAGGALARSQTDGEVMVDTQAPQAAELAETTASIPAGGTPSATELATDTNVESTRAAAAPAPAVVDRSIQSPRLAEFIRYSTRQAFRFAEVEEALPSAVLRDPSALDGERIECASGDPREPAVLIDLDPGDENFSTNSPLPTSTSIALSLRVLRSEGVTIAWISGNSAADADIIRSALTQSGLDPLGDDTLLLMRYPGDRKQTRRKEFSSETCLLAIAGDNRRDFDELYDYLNNRDSALALERLINNGWFLIGPDTPARPVNDEAAKDTLAAQTPDGKQD